MIRRLACLLLATHAWSGEPPMAAQLRPHLASPRPYERANAIAWAADLADPALAESLVVAIGARQLEGGEWNELRRLIAVLPEAALERLARDGNGPVGRMLIERLAKRGPEACVTIAGAWKASRPEQASALAGAALAAAKPGAPGIAQLADLAIGISGSGSGLAQTIRRLPTDALNAALINGLLAHPDAAVHAASIDALFRLPHARWDVVLAERALADPDLEVRARVVSQLASVALMTKEAWPDELLLRLLSADAPSLRSRAMSGLCSRKNDVLTPDLVLKALADPDPTMRHEGLRAVQTQKIALSEGLLLSLLDDTDDQVVDAACRYAFPHKAYAGSRALAVKLEELSAKNSSALPALMSIDSPRAIEVMARLARDVRANPRVRSSALRLLAFDRDPRVGELAAIAIADDDPSLRQTAREALAKFSGGDEGSIAAAGLAKRIGLDVDLLDILALEPAERAEQLAAIWVKLPAPGRSELLKALRLRKDGSSAEVLCIVALGTDAALAREAVAGFSGEDAVAAIIPALRLQHAADAELSAWSKRILAAQPYRSLRPAATAKTAATQRSDPTAAGSDGDTILAELRLARPTSPIEAEQLAAGHLTHPDRRVRFKARDILRQHRVNHPQAFDLEIAMCGDVDQPRSSFFPPSLLLPRLAAFAKAMTRERLDNYRKYLQTRIAEQAKIAKSANPQDAEANARRSDEERAFRRQKRERRIAQGGAATPPGADLSAPLTVDDLDITPTMWRKASSHYDAMTVEAVADGALISYLAAKEKAQASASFSARAIAKADLDFDVLQGEGLQVAVQVYTIERSTNNLESQMLVYESAAQPATTGSNRLSFATRGMWKSKATQWQFQEMDLSSKAYKGFALVIYHQGRPGRILLRSAALRRKP